MTKNYWKSNLGIALISIGTTAAALFYLGENEEAKDRFKSQLEIFTEQDSKFHDRFLKENKLEYLPSDDRYIDLLSRPIPWKQMNYRLRRFQEAHLKGERK